MKRPLYILTISCCILSCTSNSNTDLEQVSETDSNRIILDEPESIQQPKKIILPIPEFKDFKIYCETSGFLSNSEGQKFKRQSNDGRFGYYSLFNSDRIKTKKFQRVGDLTVFIPHNDKWDFDDTTQSFAGISVIESGLEIFDGIQVGSTISELENVLGKPNLTSDSLVTYFDSNGTIGIFTTKKNVITSIHYGILNEVFDSSATLDRIVGVKNAW